MSTTTKVIKNFYNEDITIEYTTLNNGVQMPKIGFGCYQIPPAETEKAVTEALKLGYRLIDTAQSYMNEKGVGEAIKKSGIPREEIFITTKIWISRMGDEKTEKSIYQSMRDLQVEYIDLVILHQSFGDYYGAYRALEKLYKEGKIRAIGVSNFFPDRLLDLIMFNDIVPALNQVETHVFNQQIQAHELMKKYKICHQAWSPMACGRNNIFENETLQKIAKKHNKSVAQVALRYLLQRDVMIIPKSTHIERMKENMRVFDFELDEDDMKEILQLDQKKSAFFDHKDPKIVEWFGQLIKQRGI